MFLLGEISASHCIKKKKNIVENSPYSTKNKFSLFLFSRIKNGDKSARKDVT
jgi:hypothetical protein